MRHVPLLIVVLVACGGGEERPAEPSAPLAVEPEPEADEPEADEPEADEPEADEPEADEPEADEPAAEIDETDATCEPIATCGCWMACARVVAHGDVVRVLDGTHAGEDLRRTRDCATLSGEETCRRVCDSDEPDATCRDGLVAEAEACTEACPPTEAPFHCEAASSGCFRVAHPRRSASRP